MVSDDQAVHVSARNATEDLRSVVLTTSANALRDFSGDVEGEPRT